MKVECKASNPRPSEYNKTEGALDIDYVLAIDGLTQIAIPGIATLIPMKTPGQRKYAVTIEEPNFIRRMKKDDRIECLKILKSTCEAAVEFI